MIKEEYFALRIKLNVEQNINKAKQREECILHFFFSNFFHITCVRDITLHMQPAKESVLLGKVQFENLYC